MSIASGCLPVPAPPGWTQRLKQAAVILVGLVLLYAVVGFLLAPWLAERRLGSVLQPALEAAGKVQLRGLQVATLWPFVRNRLRLSEMQGSAGQSLRLDGMAIDLADVPLARAGENSRLLAMKRITAGGGSLNLAGRVSVASAGAVSAQLQVAPTDPAGWAQRRLQ